MVAKGVPTFRQTHAYSDILLVIALYSKTGGKNGKHAAITDSSAISTVSYIGVQVFEHMYGRQFRVIPEATALFFTKQFALLPPISFLSTLSSPPDIPSSSNHLELSLEGISIFRVCKSQAGCSQFEKAMTLFWKWKQADEADD